MEGGNPLEVFFPLCTVKICRILDEAHSKHVSSSMHVFRWKQATDIFFFEHVSIGTYFEKYVSLIILWCATS